MRNLFFAVSLTLAISISSAAQTQAPTAESFLGYAIGDRFTHHHRIVDYFEALDAASSRVRLVRYGETYEGRPLLYAIVTSEENHARLDELQRQYRQLNDPRTITAADAQRLTSTLPVVVWLAYGVHGDESSSAEAAMMTAGTLASLDDESLLQSVVVIIDPLQNPDGRERYVNAFHQRRGASPNVDPVAVEHSDAALFGRTNHYFTDMNRDWAWASQKETKARINAFRAWNPQVFVDVHEMSAESTYFFPPDATPINTNVPADTEKWLELFGRANAEVFSANQWPFFVRERFDLFYPGYGDSWPTLRGSIGMTYEVAGGRRAGTHYRRADDAILTLADRAKRHFTASMMTVRTAAAQRAGLLDHQHKALRDQLTRKTTFVVDATAPNAKRLFELMQLHGVEVGRLRAPARLKGTDIRSGRADTREFPAGSLVVTTAQPLGGFVQALFERSPIIQESFVRQQTTKIEADEEDDFYDITAWSLPLAMELPTFAVNGAVATEPMHQWPAAAVDLASPGYAWLISPRQSDFYRVLGRLLRAGVKFSVSATELSRDLPRGTLVIERHRNTPALEETLQRIVSQTGVRVNRAASVWQEGPALGSNDIVFVKAPAIALLHSPDIDLTSFGALWHTFDVETEIPHTVVGESFLKSRDLDRYRVLVIPSGDFDLLEALGKRGAENVKRWVEAGGTIVAIKDSAAGLRHKDVALSKVKEWKRDEKKEGTSDEDEGEAERINDYRVPGSAFRTTANLRSYLTFGIDTPPVVLMEGTDALLPLPRKSDNVIAVASGDPLVAGFAWPQAIERLSGSSYLTHERVGSGSVITFADQPYYRLFWRSTLPLLMNAVLYSPSFNDAR